MATNCFTTFISQGNMQVKAVNGKRTGKGKYFKFTLGAYTGTLPCISQTTCGKATYCGYNITCLYILVSYKISQAFFKVGSGMQPQGKYFLSFRHFSGAKITL